MKTAVELIQGLLFKLRSFGIPIEGPTDVFCNSEAVTKKVRSPNRRYNKDT